MTDIEARKVEIGFGICSSLYLMCACACVCAFVGLLVRSCVWVHVHLCACAFVFLPSTSCHWVPRSEGGGDALRADEEEVPRL